MAEKRVHVIVEGRVQGVYFRAHTRDEALKQGLSGWVRNRPDSSVEAEIEGEAGAVDRMVQWFYQGSPYSRVSRVRLTDLPLTGDKSTFVIRFD